MTMRNRKPGQIGALAGVQSAARATSAPRVRVMSLRMKLIGVVLVTTLVALLVALAAMVAYDLRAYHQAWVNDMTTQAELLGQTSAPALAFDDAKLARENLNLLRIRPQVRAAAVYLASGNVFATYAASASENRFPRLPEPDGASVRGRDLVVFKRVISNGEILGTVYLKADYELYDRVQSYLGIAAAVIAVAMLVAFALSSWLQRIVTRPILSVGKIAREVVEQRDYSRRAQRLSDDEVGELVGAFNDMMAEIERRTAELERSLRDNAIEVAERRAAQQEVMRLNAGLEQRVRERTAQLEQVNRGLEEATASAEHANRAKSEFISSMSHELRTPLNAILGFGQLMHASDIELPAAKQKEFSKHIVHAGNHLLKLIDEILDLAKIESAQMMLSLEMVTLDTVLDECRTMIVPAAAKRRVQTRFPAVCTAAVMADRTRLKQVLLNLLSNAIKYNVEGGSVSVDVSDAVAGRVRISVQDTGPGLRSEQVGALFQPFNRLGQEATSVEGTGIGLVVTKRLVELMHGTIDVSSTVGVGSVFSIELPAVLEVSKPAMRADDAAFASAPRSSRMGGLAEPLLLYVEDNPANLTLVQEIVGLRGGMRLISAPDAQLGIELARAHQPQLILLDIHLPGLNGMDALAILRADPSTAGIPVIALTANAMPSHRERALAAGFFRYVTKPIGVRELIDAIDAALNEAG
jgi:signal transduction histidine kinase/ActR/RegA family two-component response regulator